MSITLNRELEKLESDIRAAVVASDEFQYQELLKRKAETQDKLFFAESKAMKSELENLESERSFGLSVRDELIDEAKQAADVVLVARNALYEAETAYQAILARQYFNETQTEQQRKDIRALQQKLDAHINSKLSGVTTNE